MKRIALSTLSLALLGAAGAAHAQSSVTLYGTIDTSITFVHNANAAGQNQWSVGNSSNGDLSGTRWGLKGQEDLGGGLKAIFQLENGFNPSTGALAQGGREFGRQAFVGLAADQYGTFTLGRQYDPLVDLVQGITADNYFGSTFATAGDVDNYDNSSRTNNAIKYVSPVFSGLQVEGMYAFGGVAGQTGSGQTWSAAAAYNNGPFSIAAGYFVADNPSVEGLVRPSTSDRHGLGRHLGRHLRRLADQPRSSRPPSRSTLPASRRSMWPVRSRSARATATRNTRRMGSRPSPRPRNSTRARLPRLPGDAGHPAGRRLQLYEVERRHRRDVPSGFGGRGLQLVQAHRRLSGGRIPARQRRNA